MFLGIKNISFFFCENVKKIFAGKAFFVFGFGNILIWIHILASIAKKIFCDWLVCRMRLYQMS